MAKPKLLQIGQGRAHSMCQMSFEQRLAFISAGLPIILDSARGFWAASLQLKDRPRESEVLKGFAEEEASKILILIDAVRCPRKLIAQKIAKQVNDFYSHLARLIYAEVTDGWSQDVTAVRQRVEPLRKAHYLEGNMGEYILPNSMIYKRESKLYADVEAYEDGRPMWNAPTGYVGHFHREPSSLTVCEAMSAMGMFTLAGLTATSDVWGGHFFAEAESIHDAKKLTQQLLARLIDENLPREDASQKHVDALYQHWPLPMYDVELSITPVTLDELKAEQERLFWSEVDP